MPCPFHVVRLGPELPLVLTGDRNGSCAHCGAGCTEADISHLNVVKVEQLKKWGIAASVRPSNAVGVGGTASPWRSRNAGAGAQAAALKPLGRPGGGAATPMRSFTIDNARARVAATSTQFWTISHGFLLDANPTCAVRWNLLGAHVYGMLIGACNLTLCMRHGVQVDTAGRVVDAHSGNILQHNGTFYLYGILDLGLILKFHPILSSHESSLAKVAPCR